MIVVYAESMAIDFQAGLFSDAAIEVPPLTGRVRRVPLSQGAWADLAPGWIAGADEVFPRLVESIPWHAERREMYERTVDVPRLLCMYGVGDELPDPVLTRARDELNRYYATELGEEFVTAGCCYYRDGRDSVAWHGDRIGRSRTEDTMVAIVSFGSPRHLSLRPVGGRLHGSYPLGHGDLIVMGGSCQRTWEHAILKTGRAVGPRISVQFRPYNVF